MRIVEIVDSLAFGGTERMVSDLAVALRARGHGVSIVCLRVLGELAQGLDSAGIRMVALEKREGPQFGTLWKLKQLLKELDAQVVHTHNPLVHHYGVVAGRLAGVGAIVSTVHGIANLGERAGPKEVLFSAMSRFTDRIVAVCPMAEREFGKRNYIPRDRLISINNGIAVEAFAGIGRRTRDGRFVFGIVGRLVPVKDHRTLLQAFARLAQESAAVELEILGDGPLRTSLESLSRELGIADRVLFHGFSDNVAAFFERVDAAVLCSESEGLPLSVLEAMASGLPIIGTAVGGIPDLLKGADCGILVPAGDAVALASAMRELLEKTDLEREQMGHRGRQYAQGGYSIESMALEYERLFSGILASRA